MIRLGFLMLMLALMGGIGVFIFSNSFAVGESNLYLRQLQANIEAEETRIRILEAEWSYLNQPERLQRLAETYTDLRPMPTPYLLTSLDGLEGEVARELARKTGRDPDMLPLPLSKPAREGDFIADPVTLAAPSAPHYDLAGILQNITSRGGGAQ